MANDFSKTNSGDLDAVTGGTGTILPHVPATGVTLANSTTYYFPFGAAYAGLPSQTPLSSVHLKWDANVVATFIIQTCNFPDYRGPAGHTHVGAIDVSDFDATAGNWITEDPSSAYVGTVGAGITVTNLSIAVAGGAAGGCTVHIGNFGTRRCRVRATVTTGGVVRCNVHGKAAA